MKKHFVNLIIILIFSLAGIRALFHPGLYTAHDIWHQVARLYHYQAAVADGQFPPYWIGTLANGFGYPLFFFSYHFPWLVGLPLLWLGASIPIALKTLFITSYFLSGVFMYFFVSQLFRSQVAGLLVAILYLWAPYRFLTTLVSASMGTVFVFVFLPILFWGIYKIWKDKRPNTGIISTAVGLAGVVLSHLGTLPSILPMLFIFVLVLFIQEDVESRLQFIKNTGLALLLGILLSSFYLIPAVYYSQFTQAREIFSNFYKNHFVNFDQLVYSKWGYGIIKQTAKEGAISFQVGIAQWLAVSGVTLGLLLDKIPKSLQKIAIFLVLSFGLSILAMLDVSRPIWDIAVKFVTLDYPTRFMLPATFVGSLFSGVLLLTIKKGLRPLVFLGIVLVALYTNRNHLRVNMYTDFPVSLYVDSEITTTSFHEFLSKWTDITLLSESAPSVIYPQDLTVSEISQNTKRLAFRLKTAKSLTVSLRQFSFPGQTLYMDGKKTDFLKDMQGRIQFNAPAREHKVLVQFEETPPIKAGKLVTLFGIVGLVKIWRRKRD